MNLHRQYFELNKYVKEVIKIPYKPLVEPGARRYPFRFYMFSEFYMQIFCMYIYIVYIKIKTKQIKEFNK